MATNTDMTALDGAAQFVRQFGEVWQQPSVQRLDELTHDDVQYVQPLHRTITGRKAAADFWRQMLAMIPDLRAEVLNWAHREGAVYIEFRMSGTIAGNPITWEAVDRYRLEDGKVRQRIAYFDPLPLAGKVARRPRSLFAFIRFGARQALGRHAS
jgi:hypothetical protein